MGTSLAVQWLRLGLPMWGVGMGSIPGRGTNILHAMQCGQKKKNEIVLLIKQLSAVLPYP